MTIKKVLEKIENGYYTKPITEAYPRSARYTKIVDGKLVTVYHAVLDESKVFETFTFNVEDENKTYIWEKN